MKNYPYFCDVEMTHHRLKNRIVSAIMTLEHIISLIKPIEWEEDNRSGREVYIYVKSPSEFFGRDCIESVLDKNTGQIIGWKLPLYHFVEEDNLFSKEEAKHYFFKRLRNFLFQFLVIDDIPRSKDVSLTYEEFKTYVKPIEWQDKTLYNQHLFGVTFPRRLEHVEVYSDCYSENDTLSWFTDLYPLSEEVFKTKEDAMNAVYEYHCKWLSKFFILDNQPK